MAFMIGILVNQQMLTHTHTYILKAAFFVRNTFEINYALFSSSYANSVWSFVFFTQNALVPLTPSHPSFSVHSSQTQRSPHVFYRHDLINQLQHNHALVTLVAENLSAYMETMRQLSKGS